MKKNHLKYTMGYRIFELLNDGYMKVTALLPDDIIEEVKKLSGGKNITESLLIALQGYIAQQRIRKSIQKVKDKPLQFKDGFTAEKVRAQNRES
jgi:hypothetical protein